MAWGGEPANYLLKNDRTINKAICTMHFKNKFEALKPLYKYLNILLLNNTKKLMQGKFMWKLINKKHPICIHSKFSLDFSMAINSNNNKKLSILFHRTNITKSFHQVSSCSITENQLNPKTNLIHCAKPLLKVAKQDLHIFF